MSTDLDGSRPQSSVTLVDNAGHSVQGDQPVVLAGLLASVLNCDT